MKLKKYTYHMWGYLVLGIIVGVNAICESSEIVDRLGKLLLLGILFYREIKMLCSYKKIPTRNERAIDKGEFVERYRPYRIKVMLIWILFGCLCVAVKLAIQISNGAYFAMAFIFFSLDLVFINHLCLLQVLSDTKKKAVTCCCGCPCRGWDILMINTPLFFAIKSEYMYEEILTIVAIILGFLTFIQWERKKYVLVIDKKVKCAEHCNLSRCIEYRV